MHAQMLARTVSLALVVLTLAACGGGAPVTDETPPPGVPETATGTAPPSGGAGETSDDAAGGVTGGEARTFDFPTGPAVLVSMAHEPPGDRVDATGAYLPANGKPTLAWVDAIW